MRIVPTVIAAIVLASLLATPAAAEPPRAPRTTPGLELDLRVDDDGIRLDHRLFGPRGLAAMAWLQGRAGRTGVSLEGRLGADRHALDFALRAGTDGASVRWWRE